MIISNNLRLNIVNLSDQFFCEHFTWSSICINTAILHHINRITIQGCNIEVMKRSKHRLAYLLYRI